MNRIGKLKNIFTTFFLLLYYDLYTYQSFLCTTILIFIYRALKQFKVQTQAGAKIILLISLSFFVVFYEESVSPNAVDI